MLCLVEMHESDILIIQKCSYKSDQCWWNHQCNDAIFSHTFVHLYSCKSKNEWLSLKWLWNYFRKHYIDVRWCNSNWTLGHKRKKRWGGGITTRLPFHYIKHFIPSLIRKITFFRQYSCVFLSNEMDDENIETNCRSIVDSCY